MLISNHLILSNSHQRFSPNNSTEIAPLKVPSELCVSKSNARSQFSSWPISNIWHSLWLPPPWPTIVIKFKGTTNYWFSSYLTGLFCKVPCLDPFHLTNCLMLKCRRNQSLDLFSSVSKFISLVVLSILLIQTYADNSKFIPIAWTSPLKYNERQSYYNSLKVLQNLDTHTHTSSHWPHHPQLPGLGRHLPWGFCSCSFCLQHSPQLLCQLCQVFIQTPPSVRTSWSLLLKIVLFFFLFYYSPEQLSPYNICLLINFFMSSPIKHPIGSEILICYMFTDISPVPGIKHAFIKQLLNK